MNKLIRLKKKKKKAFLYEDIFIISKREKYLNIVDVDVVKNKILVMKTNKSPTSFRELYL